MLHLVEDTHVAERPTGLLREGQGGEVERLLKRGEVLQRSCETGH